MSGSAGGLGRSPGGYDPTLGAARFPLIRP
jgi:hypothetical protein